MFLCAFHIFRSVWFRFGKQNFNWHQFCSGRTVKHCFGRFLLWGLKFVYNNCNFFVTCLEWCDGALFSMKNSGSDMHPPPLEFDFSNLLGTLPPCIDDFLLRVLVFDWTAELWCLAFSGEVTGESGAVCTGRSIFLMDILLSSVNEKKSFRIVCSFKIS